MSRIILYHPEVWVRRGEDLFSVRLSMDDWYSEEEVLEALVAWTGSSSLGGAVERILAGNTLGPGWGIISACIEKVELSREIDKPG